MKYSSGCDRTEDVDVGVAEGVSVLVAGVALDHLQVGRTVTAALTHVDDLQLAIIVRQQKPRR